jgi:integrase
VALKFSRLTRPAIRALQPGARLAEHGITAERQTSGDVRYSINIMVEGQRIHRVVGRESEGVTREQAERLIETLRTRAREGRLDLPKGRKLHRSFSEAAEEYLTRLEESGGKNIGPKRMHLRRHLIPYFGSQRVDQLKDFGLKTYRKKRTDAGASDATVNREMATLSHMLRSAVKWEWFAADRIPAIEKEQESRQPIVVLSEQQASALMKGAMQDQDGRLWLFVMFGLGAAMRHREILRVRYDQIDFDTRRIFIPEAKAGEREQPITPALADALRMQRSMEEDQKGWVFPTVIPGQSKAGHRTNMARPFARAVVRAKLDPDKVTPHTMRHTAITRLVKAGVDLPTIQKISGHKTLAMVLRYVHVHGEHIDAAIGALNDAFSDAITPELHTPAVPDQPDEGRVIAISAAKSAA